MDNELAYKSAVELVEAFRAKTLSPVEVTKAALDRIEDLNRRVNAIYFVSLESALAQARASEARWLRGEPNGLLDGVPTTVKDALACTGMPAYRGSAASPDAGVVAQTDTPAVARLRKSGSVILGKNTMCDYGIVAGSVSSKFGPTRNPWDLTKTAGASSSGAGASIAAGFNPLALGTDIVGSIRIPASFCGLVGLKPSFGRVPYDPPGSPGLVIGPMARCTEDVALMLDCIARPDARDYTALPAATFSYRERLREPLWHPRIKLIRSLGIGVQPEAEITETVVAAARRLAQVGAVVDEADDVRIPSDLIRLAERFYRARCYVELNKIDPARQPRSPLLHSWTRTTEGESAADMMDAIQAMTALRERAMSLIDGYDFLVLPTFPTAPFAAELAAPDESCLFDAWCSTFLFNLTEQPAISIPCGMTSGGLPIGMQIVGRRYDDLGVLQLAWMHEQLAGRNQAWPEL